jgi:hypothetical protein
MKHFYLGCKILATISLLVGGLLSAVTYPSYIDVINGVAAGSCIFVMWVLDRDRKGNFNG